MRVKKQHLGVIPKINLNKEQANTIEWGPDEIEYEVVGTRTIESITDYGYLSATQFIATTEPQDLKINWSIDSPNDEQFKATISSEGCVLAWMGNGNTDVIVTATLADYPTITDSITLYGVTSV